MGYTDTFIIVAEDCAAETGVVPPERGGRPTVASIQHALLAAAPYTYTQEDVLFETEVRHKAVPDEELTVRRGSLREEFFAKSRACLRASPLPKSYGWGLHFDAEGRVALYGVDSPEYRGFAAGEHAEVTVLKAMRSRRR